MVLESEEKELILLECITNLWIAYYLVKDYNY